MKAVDLIQYKINESPETMEVKRKLNDIINHVNMIDEIQIDMVKTSKKNNESIAQLIKDFKNLHKLMSNQNWQ
jgi:Asp-tRNA(Asn)/Glu-tRNA(Gln) amidotransferase C subunit